MARKNKIQVIIAPQRDFPLLKRFRDILPVTDTTIFAYDGIIYCNSLLPDHLIVHEIEHFKQQRKYGLEQWVEGYLNEPTFRRQMEIEAYRTQIKSVKDRNLRTKVRYECARNLSSVLYGSLLSYEKALQVLKI